MQDGLILQLDGIEKGSDPNKWQSLVSDDFIDITNAQPLAKGFAIPPAIDNNLPRYSSLYTIQYCVELNDLNVSRVYIAPVMNDQCMLRYYKSSLDTWQFYRHVENTAKTAVRFTGWSEKKLSCSFNESDRKAIFNGMLSQDFTFLGLELSNQPAIGKNGNFVLHSIRIYNRPLTDDEIMYNQRVDNLRFNLGLNLNGGIQPYTPGRALTMSRNLDLNEASPLESFDESLSTEEEECVNVTER